ncbi:hypothetical protein [Clostridium senegalense]|uniref:hypothetical protein n=1 Tax=Clostridium senegalense TaxID=1465809 RepID=UPI000288F268|nr:hypothetical protein [Clostridium senegalense]
MNIKQYVKQTLSNKEILDLLADGRVFFLHANNPNKEMYLEYEIINEYGKEYSEGEERETTYIVQVDIFSTGDYSQVEEKVKEIMLKNGFNRDSAVDLYEEDTKLYHKAIRFNITRNFDNN